MLNSLLILLAATFISFLGSLQLGPVNLFVINCALFESKRTAFFVAIGGCIPEFIYCALAVFANGYLLEYGGLITAIKIVFIALLIAIGITLYFKKQSTVIQKYESSAAKPSIKYIFKGFSLAILNPQLLLFWIFVQVYFNSISFLQIQSNLQKISYIMGAGIGAFILLASFIIVVMKYREAILRYLNNKYYFKVLSVLLVAIAIQQIWLLSNNT